MMMQMILIVLREEDFEAKIIKFSRVLSIFIIHESNYLEI